MNKKNKYRGKTLNGEWLYGDLEYDRQKDIARIHTYNKDGIYERQYIVNTETVGQFTGLYDKNGKEIYEDDIVMWDVDNRLYLVAFFGGMFYASVVKDEGIGMIGGFPLHRLTNQVYELCGIAGNRYDNPELLKND